jgi:hypothetical protein
MNAKGIRATEKLFQILITGKLLSRLTALAACCPPRLFFLSNFQIFGLFGKLAARWSTSRRECSDPLDSEHRQDDRGDGPVTSTGSRLSGKNLTVHKVLQ